jgi:hypothetical protein
VGPGAAGRARPGPPAHPAPGLASCLGVIPPFGGNSPGLAPGYIQML